MKGFKKAVALLLVVLSVLALSSCGKVGKWIIKTDNAEVPVGLYISNLSNYYAYATYMVENKNNSPLGQTVEIPAEDDKPAEKKDAGKWMQEMAMNSCLTVLNLLERCNAAGIELTKEEEEEVEAAVQSDWSTGAASYEASGVSLNTVRLVYRYEALMVKYFDYLYGNEGVHEVVKDETVKEYYLDNFTKIEYFRVYMGSYTSGSKEYDAVVEYLRGLANQVYSGKLTLEKAMEEYNKKYEASRTLTLERKEAKAQYEEEFYKKFISMKNEGCTSFVYDNYAYVLVKHDVAKDTEYLEEHLDSIRMEMKTEEFSDLLLEQEDSLKFTTNEAALSKYNPKWVEKMREKTAA